MEDIKCANLRVIYLSPDSERQSRIYPEGVTYNFRVLYIELNLSKVNLSPNGGPTTKNSISLGWEASLSYWPGRNSGADYWTLTAHVVIASFATPQMMQWKISVSKLSPTFVYVALWENFVHQFNPNVRPSLLLRASTRNAAYRWRRPPFCDQIKQAKPQ